MRPFLMAIVLAAACAAPPAAGSASPLERLVGRTLWGTVTSVADGDTVRARLEGFDGRVTIRLEGIDAPERGEPFSTRARNEVRGLLTNKRVRIEAMDVDPYDRLVARLVVDGKDTSVHLVDAGLACHFTRFRNDPELARAQQSARASGRGLWGHPRKPRCVEFVR